MFKTEFFKIAERNPFRQVLRLYNGARVLHYWRREEQAKRASPKNLRNFERRVYSQNGEDGILEEIFRRVGTTNRFFVEFGIETGEETNGRHLLERQGWQGVWIEASEVDSAKATKLFESWPVEVVQAFIDKDNILELFSKAGVPEELDLLSVDIDGNDYWVLSEALTKYRPRVICCEYNASITPDIDWVMPYNKEHLWDRTRHYGASLAALDRLCRGHDYALVGCEHRGVNAFFVRKDLASDDLFDGVGQGAEYHYVCPKQHKVFFGHPHTLSGKIYVTASIDAAVRRGIERIRQTVGV